MRRIITILALGLVIYLLRRLVQERVARSRAADSSRGGDSFPPT